MSFKIAVIGALSSVGREFLNELAESGFNSENVIAIESESRYSLGKQISFGDDDIGIENINKISFKGVSVAIFLDSVGISEQFIPKAIDSGCFIIDSTLSNSKEVSIMPYTKKTLQNAMPKRFLNIPSPVGIHILTSLIPIYETLGIENLSLSICQNTGLAGKAHMDELFKQTRGIFVNESASTHQKNFTKQIAFNIIPEVGEIGADGKTHAEKEVEELIKTTFQVIPQVTSLWVPTFVGNSIIAHIKTKKDIDLEALSNVYKSKREELNIVFANYNQKSGYATPQETGGEDSTFISRLRVFDKQSLGLWSVADTNRISALNIIKIITTLQSMWK